VFDKGTAPLQLYILVGFCSLVSQPFFMHGAEKKPGHCCTLFVNTAGMLAAPIKSLCTICDDTNNFILNICEISMKNDVITAVDPVKSCKQNGLLRTYD